MYAQISRIGQLSAVSLCACIYIYIGPFRLRPWNVFVRKSDVGVHSPSIPCYN